MEGFRPSAHLKELVLNNLEHFMRYFYEGPLRIESLLFLEHIFT